MMMKLLRWALLAPVAAFDGWMPHEFCKPVPGSPGWPTVDAWNALNQSVSGRLSNTGPLLGAVCHPDRPEFNNASCEVVQAQWSNTSFVAMNPVAVDYNDETCLPNATVPCTGDGYPAYVIEAHNAQDVQEGVQFAKRTGFRLVIKATGHDVPGRSSGPDSLLIYTRHIRGVEVNHSDPRALELGGSASVKIYAGEQMRHVYPLASKYKITAIGGADPNVGIGGWLSGGGHGPLTPKYGMGVDQVIEMEVVTADGCLRTINADSDPDLFWALRGGGSGTFAVLISVTMKAYAPIHVSNLRFSYNTTANSETFWSLTAYFHSQLPHLAESGAYGYYFATPNDPMENNISMKGRVYGTWIAPELSSEALIATVAPMEAYIRSGQWEDPAVAGSIADTPPSDFMKYWAETNPAGVAGFSGRLGSRLLSNSSLLGDFDKLKSALRTSSPEETLIGHLVGPAPNTLRPTGRIAGGGDSLLPAWKTTYAHVAVQNTWTPRNQSEKIQQTTSLRDVQVQALRELEPDSGCYMSEADPTEPDWQRAKFGENYARLLRIKKAWDPDGVFWCKQCVGSELWDAKGDFGIENGVGQNKVRLCQSRRRGRVSQDVAGRNRR